MRLNVRFLDNMSFTWKLMASYIVLLLIPLSVSGVYIYMRSVQSVQEQSKVVYQDMLQQKKNDIEQRFNDYEKIARNISVNPILVSYFHNTNMTDLDKIETSNRYVIPFMEWVKNLNPNTFDVHFFTYNARIFENRWVHHSTKVEKEGWFSKASGSTQRNLYWESLHEMRKFEYSGAATNDDYNYEISLFIPLMSVYNDKNTSTLIEIYLNPEELFGSLNESALYKNGLLFVLNEKDDILLQIGNGDSRLSKEAMNWSKQIRKASDSGIINLDYVSYFINIELISRLNYCLIGVSPMPAVMRKVREAQSIYIICFTLAAIFLFLISYLFTKKLMKKIKQLVKAVREVQEGNLDIAISVRGKDEIAELGQDFNIMIGRVKQLINQVYKAEILQKDAQLQSLHNQINPHFIYNTLETIRMMAVIKREKDISKAISSLGNLVRYNVSNGSNLVSMQMELKQIRNYCNLQNLMLNNRLQCNIIVDEEVASLKILKLILQPIVENAILHGFENFRGECFITVIIQQYQENVRVSIKDNGKGMATERLEAVRKWLYGDSDNPEIPLKGSGIGLRNVHQRIQFNFGASYGITIDSALGQGVEVIVIFPIIG